MIRRPHSAIVANPVLIGAVTVLVVIVGIFLAYQANNGLPFVPSRELTVDLPNGQNLVVHNEVREGGYRIGIITRLMPVEMPGGRVGARVSLKLDKSAGPIPVDSTWAVRPRSALSLKYLELTRGHSRRALPSEAHVPLSQARNPVELDQLLNVFDRRTRMGARRFLLGNAGALAARGVDLNRAFDTLPVFLGHLEPVARTLADPDTNLRRFFRSLARTARVVAPVGEQYAQSFADGATTFEAISRDERALEDSIAKTPPTLTVGERSLRYQRPFLHDVAALSGDLERSAHEVRLALPPVNSALATGTPVQRQSVQLSARTDEALGALDGLLTDPATMPALRALTATTVTLNPQLRFFGPMITVCNSWNFFWTLVAEHLSERDPTGMSERALSNSGDSQDNSVTTQGAVVPANGENLQPGGTPQYFHGQAFGRAVDEQGNADCEDAQRGYINSLISPYVEGKNRERFKHLVSQPRTPGSQGPLFKQIVDGKGVGRTLSRVPPGETFTAEPETGPQIP